MSLISSATSSTRLTADADCRLPIGSDRRTCSRSADFTLDNPYFWKSRPKPAGQARGGGDSFRTLRLLVFHRCLEHQFTPLRILSIRCTTSSSKTCHFVLALTRSFWVPQTTILRIQSCHVTLVVRLPIAS